MTSIAIHSVNDRAKNTIDYFVFHKLRNKDKVNLIEGKQVDSEPNYLELGINILEYLKSNLDKVDTIEGIKELENFIEVATPNFDNIVEIYNHLKLKNNLVPLVETEQMIFKFLYSYLDAIKNVENKIALFHFDNFTEEFQDKIAPSLFESDQNIQNRVCEDIF